MVSTSISVCPQVNMCVSCHSDTLYVFANCSSSGLSSSLTSDVNSVNISCNAVELHSLNLIIRL